MEANRLIGRMSEEESNWFRQNSIDTFIRDRNTEMENATKKGLEKGIKQGAKTAKLEAATNLLKMNLLTAEQIAQAEGLPLEEVLELERKTK